MNKFWSLVSLLGFDERRCLGCLAPFKVPDAPGDSPENVAAAALCPLCLERFTMAGDNVCPRCGIAISSSGGGFPCGRCQQLEPPWSGFYFIGPYKGLLSELILRFKLGSNFAVARFLGELLAVKLLNQPRFDLLVPMPAHPARLLKRGYNQCRELARPISARLKLKVDVRLLQRKKATIPQAGLSAIRRKANIKGAFKCSPVNQAKILLLDDIMTTGTTIRYAVEALLESGAASVSVCVAARTPLGE